MSGRMLRRAVITRLMDQVAEFDGRVLDRAVEGTAYPYAALGPSYWVSAPAQCIGVRVRTLQVDIWCEGSKGACEDLTDAVSDALEGWSDPAGLTMPPLRVSLARVMDDPGGAFHGVVQIEARVEG